MIKEPKDDIVAIIQEVAKIVRMILIAGLIALLIIYGGLEHLLAFSFIAFIWLVGSFIKGID